MVELPQGARPSSGNQSPFLSLCKSTTVRVILPIIVSAHLGWYYLRSHMVYDFEENRYVYQSNPKGAQ